MSLMPRDTGTQIPYDESFYQGQQDGSVSSAQIVVPIVLSLFPCRSVVDFGCCVGGWLKEFERNGVADYLGVDGDYVARHLLKIPADRFRPIDLRNVSDLGRGFDLACSLEVAEHLPEDRAKSFVAALVKAAPVVLFSAAISLQGGTEHVNEQWQSYRAKLFARLHRFGLHPSGDLWGSPGRMVVSSKHSGILPPRQMSSGLHSGRRPL